MTSATTNQGMESWDQQKTRLKAKFLMLLDSDLKFDMEEMNGKLNNAEVTLDNTKDKEGMNISAI